MSSVHFFGQYKSMLARVLANTGEICEEDTQKPQLSTNNTPLLRIKLIRKKVWEVNFRHNGLK